MNNGLVIADSGPIFSLAIVDELELLNQLFNAKHKEDKTKDL